MTWTAALRRAGATVPALGPHEELERAIEIATDVRGDLVGTGASFAMIYIDAAIRSMRHARAALIRDAWAGRSGAGHLEGWQRLTFSDMVPASILLRREDATDVWQRGRVLEDGPAPCDGADVDWRWPRAVDLGCDLLASEDARSLAGTTVGSAMLLDALAHGAWFKPNSATRWTAGVTAARSIVAALAGGAAVGTLAPALAGQRIDRDVLLLIERLGWRRDPAARWRVRTADGGRAEATGRPD